MTENQRYLGSRLTGPGINIDSDIAAINFSPVIEVFGANPNQLIFTEDPPPDEQGSLTVQ